MDWGIMTLKDLIEVLSYLNQLVAALVLIPAAYTYLVHRDQLSFDVIKSCVDRFQEVVPYMESCNAEEKKRA